MQVLATTQTTGTPYRLLRDRLHEIVVDRVAAGVTVTLQRRTPEDRWVNVNGYFWDEDAAGTELHRGTVGEIYRLAASAAGPVGFAAPVDGQDVEEA